MATEFIDVSGKTIDEAIKTALAQLSLEREEVSVEVLAQPKSGFLGIGSSNAKIRVSYEAPDVIEPAIGTEAFLSGLLEKMNVPGTISLDRRKDDEGADVLAFNVEGKDMGILIGRRGEMLDAIQYVTSLVAKKTEGEHTRVTLDTENYRAKREETLASLATRTAQKVLKYKKNATLEPMHSHERRIIHSTLQDFKGITTYSTGSEPYRRVVVAIEGSQKPASQDQNSRPGGSRGGYQGKKPYVKK